MIDTRKVSRRTLGFDSIAQLQDELARIEAAHAAGTLTTAGNWAPGQIFGHLAAWIGYAYDGYPMNPPAWVRVAGRIARPLFMRMKMPPGIRIHGAAEGTYGIEPLEFSEGLARLRAALDRLESTPPIKASPMLGRLTHASSIRINLNHAELHLGYLRPGATTVSG